MRAILTALSLVVTAGAGALGVAPYASAAPVVEIRPGALAAGAAPREPYVDGTVVVDGERRTETGADEVQLLGTTAGDVVVAASYPDRPQRVLRLGDDGTWTVVADRVDLGSVRLSDDGSELVTVTTRARRSTLRLIDAVTGAVTASRTVRGYVDLHDVSAGRVLLVRYGPDRTLVWRTGRDTLRVLVPRATSYGDFETDRISWFDGDPYDGGCAVLSRLRRPDERVWRSCREAVASISPDGSRLLTLHKLTDGLGPAELRLRNARGRLLATYRTGGWFPRWQWESGRTLLLDTNGTSQRAIVRCTRAACERTTDPAPVQAPRAAFRAARIIGSWSGSRA